MARESRQDLGRRAWYVSGLKSERDIFLHNVGFISFKETRTRHFFLHNVGFIFFKVVSCSKLFKKILFAIYDVLSERALTRIFLESFL